LATLTVSLVLSSATVAVATAPTPRFSVSPSSARAGAHANLDVSIAFDPPTSDVKGIVLHLPAGLRANAGAAPFCRHGRLLADLCPLGTKVGSVSVTGSALGFEAEAARNVYNVRPRHGERLRLGIPLFGTASRGGLALVLPVRARRGDGGLDLALAGPPREFAGYPIQIERLRFRIAGTVGGARRGRRRRPFLTNPRSCAPARSVLDVTAYDGSSARVESSFTPSGC
jgi:hypothetical protein